MKSNNNATTTKVAAEIAPAEVPVATKSDTALAIKVFLIAGGFIGALWLLEKIVSAS